MTVYNGSGDGNYFVGVEVKIAADPAPEGMMFDSWVIESGKPDIAEDRLSTTTLVMSDSATIVRATYQNIQKYSLIVNNGDGSGSYLPGETFFIIAAPAPAGELFDKWVVEAGSPSIANEYGPFTTVTMTAEDAVVTATYMNPNVSAESVKVHDNVGGIYPNPANNEITINLTVAKATLVYISIYDLRGQEVVKGIHSIYLPAGNHRLTVPLSEIKSGTYLMKIRTDTGAYTELFHHL